MIKGPRSNKRSDSVCKEKKVCFGKRKGMTYRDARKKKSIKAYYFIKWEKNMNKLSGYRTL